jgi:hypothetical protein
VDARPRRNPAPRTYFDQRESNFSARALLAEASRPYNEPRTFDEAVNGPDSEKWIKSIDEELASHAKHGTWVLESLPLGRKTIGHTWVFKIKRDGRYKSRLCATGYSQIRGVDFNETFAPTLSFKSIRTILAIAAAEDLTLRHLDVTTAFLYGTLPSDQPALFMSPPRALNATSNLVCKLQKGIYGLRQSSRLWNAELNAFLISLGFSRHVTDPCVYSRRVGEDVLVLAVYVDDIIVAASSRRQAKWVQSRLFAKYQMTDCGPLEWFLGCHIRHDKKAKTISIDQSHYIETILLRYGMQNCKPVSTPAEPGFVMTSLMSPQNEQERRFMADKPYRGVIGSLMFAMVCTRPDISLSVGLVCRYMHDPGKRHWQAALRILAYLRGHTDLGITYDGHRGLVPYAYSDASWADDRDQRRSTTGFVLFLAGAAISWKSRLQPTTSLSSTEAEYKSAGAGVQEILAVRSALVELGYPHAAPTTLFEDNQGAISLALNPVAHYRTRHIDIRHHFIRQKVADKSVALEYISTKLMIADALTKPLSTDTFRRFRDAMMGARR